MPIQTDLVKIKEMADKHRRSSGGHYPEALRLACVRAVRKGLPHAIVREAVGVSATGLALWLKAATKTRPPEPAPIIVPLEGSHQRPSPPTFFFCVLKLGRFAVRFEVRSAAS